MAHKKAGGSSRNGRDSRGQRRGVKKFGGEQVRRHVGCAIDDDLGATDLVKERVASIRIEPREAIVFEVAQVTLDEWPCWR